MEHISSTLSLFPSSIDNRDRNWRRVLNREMYDLYESAYKEREQWAKINKVKINKKLSPSSFCFLKTSHLKTPQDFHTSISYIKQYGWGWYEKNIK